MVNSNFALTFLSKKPRFLRHYARSVSSAFGIPKKKEAITPCTKTSGAYLDGKFQGGIKKVSTQKKTRLKLFLVSYERSSHHMISQNFNAKFRHFNALTF